MLAAVLSGMGIVMGISTASGSLFGLNLVRFLINYRLPVTAMAGYMLVPRAPTNPFFRRHKLEIELSQSESRTA